MSGSSAANPKSDLAGLKILVIDDSKTIRRTAETLLAYAGARGKWRHVGRVNTLKRMRHFADLCDSVDGSGFSKLSDRAVASFLPATSDAGAARKSAVLECKSHSAGARSRRQGMIDRIHLQEDL